MTPEAADWVSCGKVAYPSRKAARQAVRRLLMHDPRPRAYRCATHPGHWHVGHIPDAVRQGTITRDRWHRQKSRPDGAS
jgi:hypothetical protein